MPTYAPPARADIAGTPSNATAKAGFGALWDYVTSLLGASGTPADARTALGLGTAATQASTAFATATQGATADAALPKAGGSMTGGINEARGSVAMHATTMDLWAQPNIIDGTGSAVTITGIANAPQAGARRVLYPIAATVITNGATFAVDGAANYTTEAGDALEFEAITTSTYKVHVTKKDGTAVVTSAASHGQCRLSLSAGSLKLLPYNGNRLIVGGVSCTVPDAGVTLAPTGLSATTLYYIYATQSGGAIDALEASTTGHSTDTAAGNKGVEIKTGDSTRTLVGMAYVKTAATFADSLTQRFVASWFNPKRKTAMVVLGADSNRTEGTDTEINSSYLAEACMFAQTPKVFGRSLLANSVAASTTYFTAYLDASIPTGGIDIGVFTAATNNVRFNTKIEGSPTADLADGYHTVKGYGKVSGGTATYYATYSAWGMDFEG